MCRRRGAALPLCGCAAACCRGRRCRARAQPVFALLASLRSPADVLAAPLFLATFSLHPLYNSPSHLPPCVFATAPSPSHSIRHTCILHYAASGCGCQHSSSGHGDSGHAGHPGFCQSVVGATVSWKQLRIMVYCASMWYTGVVHARPSWRRAAAAAADSVQAAGDHTNALAATLHQRT